MRRKAAVLILAAAMTVTASGTVYAGEKSADTARATETAEENQEKKSSGISECEAGEHQWSEWNITVPADCVTEGQQTRKCEVCGITETASIEKTEEHDLKEVSRQEATEEKPGFILYICKREGCDYQVKEEIPVKEAADPENPDENQKQEEKGSEKENTSNSEEKTEDTNGTDSKEEVEKGDTSQTSSETGKVSEKTGIEKEETEELPDEDTDEESASFAYATSSEVVAEYDPTTAVSTRKIIKNPSDPASAEEVEGMTVPEGIVKIQRDSDGNITDLAVSNSVEEIRNGFSFSSEAKTLHSISVINEKDPSKNWITLTAKKKASELGIRMKQAADGITVTLTENKKSVRIVKAASDETKITLVTSTGGTCVISRHIQKFELKEESSNLKDINGISLCDINSQKPYVKLISVKDVNSEKNKKEKTDEKAYWLQQYDDETQDPILLTVYEK